MRAKHGVRMRPRQSSALRIPIGAAELLGAEVRLIAGEERLLTPYWRSTLFMVSHTIVMRRTDINSLAIESLRREQAFDHDSALSSAMRNVNDVLSGHYPAAGGASVGPN